MAMRDPSPDFDPLALQAQHNAALRGFQHHAGERSELLEVEAEALRHSELPGGGATWQRVPGNGRDADPLDPAVRRAQLAAKPLPSEAVRTVVRLNGYVVTQGSQNITDSGEAA